MYFPMNRAIACHSNLRLIYLGILVSDSNNANIGGRPILLSILYFLLLCADPENISDGASRKDRLLKQSDASCASEDPAPRGEESRGPLKEAPEALGFCTSIPFGGLLYRTVRGGSSDPEWLNPGIV